MIEIINLEFTKKEGQKTFEFDGKERCVEETVQEYYKKNGYESIWSENIYWSTITTLLFWNEIYIRIQGIWDERYEQVNDIPIDMFRGEFYQRRSQAIENRYNEIMNLDLSNELLDSFKNHYGNKCRLVENWNTFSEEELLKPLNFFDKKVIADICIRILQDFNNHRSGLPDLIVFDNKDCFFVEVKSEKDKLRDNQIIWHKYLSENLDQRVVVALVNHKDGQIENVKKLYF